MQTVEFVRPTPQPTRPSPEPSPARRDDSGSPRLDDLRRNLVSWLSATYRDVQLESNGWITIPDIGPSVIQIEPEVVQGGHLKVEVFAPLLLDVPVTHDLLRYVAIEGARFHFGVISMDAGDDGDDPEALLQFSHSLLADALQRDELLAVVWLVAATLVAKAPELQRRFGGALYAEANR